MRLLCKIARTLKQRTQDEYLRTYHPSRCRVVSNSYRFSLLEILCHSCNLPQDDCDCNNDILDTPFIGNQNSNMSVCSTSCEDYVENAMCGRQLNRSSVDNLTNIPSIPLGMLNCLKTCAKQGKQDVTHSPEKISEYTPLGGTARQLTQYGQNIGIDIDDETLQLLKAELLLMKSEDVMRAVVSTPPDQSSQSEEPLDCGPEDNLNMCVTKTSNILKSLHNLSPQKCGDIQSWIDTDIMYKAKPNRVMQMDSGSGPQNYTAQFPLHSIIDTCLPNFKHSSVGKLA